MEKPEAEPYKNMFIFSAFIVSRTKVLFILIKSLNLCAFYFSVFFFSFNCPLRRYDKWSD